MNGSEPAGENPNQSEEIAKISRQIVADSEQQISEVLNASDDILKAIDGLRRIIANNVQATRLLNDLEAANSRSVAACSILDVIRQHTDNLQRILSQQDRRSEEDQKILAGPQSDGQGLSQQEIDDLLK